MQKQDKNFSVDSAFLPRDISGLYRFSEAAAYRNTEYLKYQEDIPTLKAFDISILHTTSRGRGDFIDWIEPDDIHSKCFSVCIDSSNLLDVSFN